jgi:hypothetical protein
MELLRFPSRGGFSVRSVFIFALTVLITALLWATLVSVPSHAATNATWTDGDALLFDNHAYNLDESFKDSTGTIPAGSIVYKAPVQAEGTERTLMVIYFASGVDPPKATSAKAVSFDYSATSALSNPHDTQTITVTPQGSDDSLAGETNSSCSVGGVGWMICPISVFLAESMDTIYSVIEQFVVTPPLMMQTENNGIYITWNIARTIANVAFVIAFLIIIYSQLTNFGVSNYGIKRLTPRLVVAALLVNISFYISAIAIDISNIIGYSIVDIFTSIRESIFTITNDNFAAVNNNPWSAITAVVLAGGGVVGGVYYLVTAGPFILITLMVGLALTALFVLLVLAARQAVIVLLVIVSPLAFVANLLPNTEKWFEKWRDLFMTMLIFFPAFAAVFGGSQLAGQLIIQNAGGNIITVILGLAVQVAPLVITPYLLKFSGGLIGKVAQIANNPRKGLMDRTKGWQQEKNQIQRNRVMSSNRGIAKPFQIIENNRRARKSLIDTYQKKADTRWEDSKRNEKLHNRHHEAEMDSKLVHAKLERKSQEHVLHSPRLLEKEMRIRTTEDGVTDLKGRTDAIYGELRSGNSTVSSRYGSQFTGLEAEASNTARNIALNSMRQQSAKRAESEKLYRDLKDNTATLEGQLIRTYAGGTQGDVGAQRAWAQAISEAHRAHQDAVSNAGAILADFNLDAADNLKIAQNVSVRGIDITDDIREAAIKRVAANGVVPHINELLTSVDFSPDGNEYFRNTLVEALKGNSSRPKYIGYGTMDKITQGISGGINDSTIDGWIEGMLLEGKLSARELATQDKDTLIRVQEAIPRLVAQPGRTPEERSAFISSLENLQTEIYSVHREKALWNSAGERKKPISMISSILEGVTGMPASRNDAPDTTDDV